MTAPECVWPLAGELLEGPVWVARDAALWFVDIKKKQVHRLDPASGERRSFDAPAFVGFVLPAAGGFVAGLADGLYRWSEDGAFQPLATVEPDLPDNRLNDGTVDAAGRLWFGTMDNNETADSGRFYRLGADAVPVAVGSDCCITNGPAISPDGRTGYFVDTLARTVDAWDIDDEGALSNQRRFCEIEEGAGHPDGPSCDGAGNVWIGLYGGWAARCYSPAGELIETVRFPVANITKVALGGPDGRTAFATTARQGLSAQEIGSQPLAGGLFSWRVEVAGLPSPEVGIGV